MLLTIAPALTFWAVAAREEAACTRNDAADCDLALVPAGLWALAALVVVVVVLDLWRPSRDDPGAGRRKKQ